MMTGSKLQEKFEFKRFMQTICPAKNHRTLKFFAFETLKKDPLSFIIFFVFETGII